MGQDLADIPGYTEAIAKAEAEERRLRDLAFFEVPLEICGIEVQQFRPRHYQLLAAGESPFFSGGRIHKVHALQFLWIVSPRYRAGDQAGMKSFVLEAAPRLPALPLVRRAIFAYVDEAWLDLRKPSGSASASSPIASVAAHFVHDFASAYGWSAAMTLDTPFAQLYQLQRLLDRDEAARNGRRLAFENAIVDQAERAFLRAWRDQQAAEAAGNVEGNAPSLPGCVGVSPLGIDGAMPSTLPTDHSPA